MNEKKLCKNGTAMIAAGIETLAVSLGMSDKQAKAMMIDMFATATKHVQEAGKLDLYNAMCKR